MKPILTLRHRFALRTAIAATLAIVGLSAVMVSCNQYSIADKSVAQRPGDRPSEERAAKEQAQPASDFYSFDGKPATIDRGQSSEGLYRLGYTTDKDGKTVLSGERGAVRAVQDPASAAAPRELLGDLPLAAIRAGVPPVPASAGKAAADQKPANTAKPADTANFRRLKLDELGGEAKVEELAKSVRVFARLPEIAGSRPAQDEELWVIQRYCPPDATRDADGRIARVPQPNDDYPGCGALVATLPGQTSPVPVPLKHTAVLANVAGNIASVSVTQQYHNPFSSKIEAVYVFPLPENAAVSDFVMKIGARTIRGVIRDRVQAEQIYADARAQGHVASLMTQERPNIFTQKVANIEPSKQIDVSVTYYNTLAYVDGSFEFVFPMVVGPRFNPAATYDGIGAAARGAASNASGQGAQVTYLRPTERSGTDISVNVNIEAGVAIESLECRSHVATITRDSASASRAVVTLSNRDSVPNKDFVLRYKVAGSALKTGMVTYRGKDGTGYFSLLVVPPADPSSCRRAPVEMVFVLDCSGSMNGRPIEQATAALERGLRRLEPGDTFQVINFAQAASQMGPAPVAATDENIRRGVAYSKSLFASGGTFMITGLRAALDFPHDPRRLRYVCFLTDGYIGNEQEILGEINARLGSSRIFSFGVGTSTNRYLLDSMAKLGRGCVAHVAAGDSPTEIVDRFFDRISRPALTDVSVDLRLGDLEFAEVFPRQIPDVYSGRAVVINGRFKERSFKGWQGVVVRGSMIGASSGNFEATEMSAAWDDRRTHPALPAIWARHKIGDMADYATAANAYQLPEAVKSIALQYGLLSNYTAFIAVDSMSQTAGTYGTTVQVPVNVPEGVNYQTTVPER